MAIATNSMKQALADAYKAQALYASLHTADPGTTGASEVTGGAPAYARKPLTWSSGTTGTVTASATFDVPSGSTPSFAGITSALTAGTFLDKVALTAQSFSTQGQLTVNFTFTEA